ncbi:isoprenylcysteine carboxylmethyltransferase family protein [Bacillaceae bacterium SIJ1]|uniref:methyltransferase family protein n=1 Tax=Litoribacterium kuwaitense TaxID=1398745 RepID=UPI0013ED826B|nr:isoprenylcysteine carboxylmethyltransferase family protein [Litoribacterium kuwaitense]NGP44682.1 isoprenylcysteine carboxylmethyltransferase family protein [Litoribacterium kuwaitense]
MWVQLIFIVATLAWALEGVLFRSTKKVRDASFTYVTAAMLFTITVIILDGIFHWSTIENTVLWQSLGVLLYAGGICLRYWGIIQMAGSFSRLVQRPERLISSGPFQFLRHPLYFALLLVTTGLSLYVGTTFGLVSSVLLLFPVLAWRAKNEEKVLHKWFGAPYLAYAKNKKRIIPFIY